ncbi:MAG: phytoene desaturase family protein, partial [Planctomycetia bacterium]
MNEPPILMLGAGVGGLSTAIRLAAAGRRVRILEQNDAVGGKMGVVKADGFRWDSGPSIITMRHVLEELFATAGRRLDDELTLKPVDPLSRCFFPDGVRFDFSADLPTTAAAIARLDERDVEGYLAYLSYAARIHRVTGPVFIYDAPPTWRSLFKVPPTDLFLADPFRTMDGAVRRFVRSPHLRQALGRFATYVGASPYMAPATLNVIAHVELTGGVWYPEGGVYAVAEALERVARGLGVEIETGRTVERILVERGRACGVRTVDGEETPAAAVVANIDVATVYERLLPAGAVSPARVRRLMRQETSCSGFVLQLGVEGVHPELAHHNLFFSGDYRKEFADVFQRGVPPDDPTVYVAVTSKSDPGHAPPGCENWFVLVNAPALG